MFFGQLFGGEVLIWNKTAVFGMTLTGHPVTVNEKLLYISDMI